MELEDKNVEVADNQENPWAETGSPWGLEVTEISEGTDQPEGKTEGVNEDGTDSDSEDSEDGKEENKLGEDAVEIDNDDQDEDGSEIDATDEDEESTESGEDSEEDESEYEDEFAYHLAKQLQKDGYLLEDQEIGNDVTMGKLYESYIEANSKRIEEEVDNRFYQTLEEYGVNEDNLYKLQAINNNTPLEYLYDITRYERFSSEELDDSEKDNAIVEMYKIRKWTDDEISDRMETLELSGNKDEELKKANDFFSNIVHNFKEHQRSLQEERKREQEEIQKQNLNILQSALDKGEINGEKLSPRQRTAFKSAIYEKTEKVQVGNDVYPLTPFEKFLFDLNNDFSKQLEAFKVYHFRGQELERLKAEAQEAADDNFLKEYRKIAKKDSQRSSIVKKNKAQKGGNYYEFETN